MEERQGTITDIIFRNEENGYTVAVMETETEYFTVVGNLPHCVRGTRYRLTGVFKNHPHYGEQFAFSEFEELLPDSSEAIFDVLCSGTVKGVGAKTAAAIIEKFGDDTVTAVIEINLTPQREVGFDAIAERIYRFDEVRTVYLMSGSFDLLVIIEGKSLKDVANFVATRLSTIEGVTATRSHFMLKPYKKDGVIINDEERDRRLVVSP